MGVIGLLCVGVVGVSCLEVRAVSAKKKEVVEFPMIRSEVAVRISGERVQGGSADARSA